MAERLVFPYLTNLEYAQDSVVRPFLPISIGLEGSVADSLALLDTGSDLNVIPFSLGIRLGADWAQHQPEHKLNGLTESLEAKNLILDVTVSDWPTIRMPFAWAETNAIPVILGQSPFFLHFNVCFMRAQREFELEFRRPRQSDL